MRAFLGCWSPETKSCVLTVSASAFLQIRQQLKIPACLTRRQDEIQQGGVLFPARIERLSVSLTRRWYKSKPVKASGLVGSAPNMLFGMAVETKGGTNRTVRLFVNPIHQINLSQPRSLAGTPSWEIGPSNHRVRAPVQRGSMASAAPKGPPPLPMRAKSGPLCASKSNQPPPLGPALMNKKKNHRMLKKWWRN